MKYQDCLLMSKETNNKMVPKLRFPDFYNCGEWEEKTLGRVCKTFSGGTPTTTQKEFYGGAIPFIRSAEIDKETTELFLTKEGLDNSSAKLINKGDVLVALYGVNSGDVSLAKIDGAINQAILCLKSEECNPFIFHYLSSKKNWIVSKYIQGGQGNLSGDIIKSVKLLFPKPDEQQKIADCLSSLDELITAQSQKLEALKAHKKGLMQQLFPAEGETVPKLRFAEFRDIWRKDKLENHVDLLSGFAFQSDFFSNEGIVLLTPKNFTKDGYANFKQENTKYTLENVDSKYICREGDLMLLLTDLTPSCELLGKPLLLTKEDGEVLLNQRIVRIISKGSIETQFLHYFFSTEAYHKRIKDTATGSTVRHSSNTTIADTEICFPSTVEQQKIADSLSSLDELITAQAEKIEALKVHKKGLMQQLFPNEP